LQEIQRAESWRQSYSDDLAEFERIYGSTDVETVVAEKEQIRYKADAELATLKSTLRNKEAEFTQSIGKVEDKRRVGNDQLSEIKAKQQAGQSQLRALFDVTDEAVNNAEQEHRRLNEELDNSARNLSVIDSEANVVVAQFQENDAALAELRRQQEVATKQSHLEQKTQELEARISRTEAQRDKELSVIQSVLSSATLENHEEIVRSEDRVVREDIANLRREIQRQNDSLSRTSGALEANAQQAAIRDKKIQKGEKFFSNLLQDETLDDVLDSKRSRIEAIHRSLKKKSSSKPVYSSFLGKVREHAICPLCEQPFANDALHQQFIARLEQTLKDLPQKTGNLEKELALLEKEKQRLESGRPEYEQLRRNKEIAESERLKALELTQTKVDLTEALEQLNERLKHAESRQRDLQSLTGPVGMLQRYVKEIFAAYRELSEVRKELDPSLPSIIVIQKRIGEFEELRMNLQQRQHDLLNKKLEFKTHHQDLESRLLRATADVRKVREGYNENCELAKTLDRLTSEITKRTAFLVSAKAKMDEQVLARQSLTADYTRQIDVQTAKLIDAISDYSSCHMRAKQIIDLRASLAGISSDDKKRELESVREAITKQRREADACDEQFRKYDVEQQ
jgi:DNA repair exonuclease SbcCD ATPase subunit